MDVQSRIREEFARQAERLSVAAAFTDAEVLERIRAAVAPTKAMKGDVALKVKNLLPATRAISHRGRGAVGQPMTPGPASSPNVSADRNPLGCRLNNEDSSTS